MLCSDSNTMNNINEILINFACKMTQGISVIKKVRGGRTEHKSRNYVLLNLN